MKNIRGEVYDSVLRSQIVDILKWLPKKDRKFNERYLETLMIMDTQSDILQRIIDVVTEAGYNTDEVYLETFFESGNDSDYDDACIAVCANVPHTDSNWFNNLASTICPSQYQIDEYDQYVRLKAKYEQQ